MERKQIVTITLAVIVVCVFIVIIPARLIYREITYHTLRKEMDVIVGNNPASEVYKQKLNEIRLKYLTTIGRVKVKPKQPTLNIVEEVQ